MTPLYMSIAAGIWYKRRMEYRICLHNISQFCFYVSIKKALTDRRIFQLHIHMSLGDIPALWIYVLQTFRRLRSLVALKNSIGGS